MKLYYISYGYTVVLYEEVDFFTQEYHISVFFVNVIPYIVTNYKILQIYSGLGTVFAVYSADYAYFLDFFKFPE